MELSGIIVNLSYFIAAVLLIYGLQQKDAGLPRLLTPQDVLLGSTHSPIGRALDRHTMKTLQAGH